MSLIEAGLTQPNATWASGTVRPQSFQDLSDILLVVTLSGTVHAHTVLPGS